MFYSNFARRAFFALLGLALVVIGACCLGLDGGVVNLTPAEIPGIVAGQAPCYATQNLTCPASTKPTECGYMPCTERDLTCSGNQIVPVYSCMPGEALFSSTGNNYTEAYTVTTGGKEGELQGNGVYCGYGMTCDSYVPTCESPQSHCSTCITGTGLCCDSDYNYTLSYATSSADPGTLLCPPYYTGWRVGGSADPLLAAAVLNGVWFSASAISNDGALN